MRRIATAALVSCVVLGVGGSRAQQAPGGGATAPEASAPAALEPKAIELLKASSAKLAAARSMSFSAVIAYESPSRLGPPLVYTTSSDVLLRRPDGLRVITPADGPASEFYYDGKSMVAFMPAEQLVATAAAPATIDAALEAAYKTADIYFPFSDLMVADPYGAIAPGLRHAFYIGQSKVVGGTTTDMVAYADDYAFVQIWIGAEDRLPRRLRAVYRDDPSRLRHDLVISDWKLDAPAADDAFVATRAKGAKPISFARPVPLAVGGPKPPGAEEPK